MSFGVEEDDDDDVDVADEDNTNLDGKTAMNSKKKVSPFGARNHRGIL